MIYLPTSHKNFEAVKASLFALQQISPHSLPLLGLPQDSFIFQTIVHHQRHDVSNPASLSRAPKAFDSSPAARHFHPLPKAATGVQE
jgi:hypothetical protein